MMKDNGFSKILVPADGSDSSLLAEETAAIVAKKTGATVTVLHVIHAVDEYYRMLYAAQGLHRHIPHNIIKEMLLLSEKEAHTIINNAQAVFNKEGVVVDTKILKGIDPAESILEFSKTNYDLIVMGTLGETEMHPYSLGSVTTKVLRHTTCPTLLAKERCSLSNLLVCIDGSAPSINALTYAFKLAHNFGSRVTLLNVQEHRLFNHSAKDAEVLGERILSRALSTIKKRDLTIEPRVEYGSASTVIIEVAENGNHDLIILGKRGLGIKRFLLGSVSSKVSDKAKCSVLIFPTKHL